MKSKLFLAFLSGLLLIIGCKESSNNNNADGAADTLENKTHTLTPFSNSPSFSDASIESMNYKDGKFIFEVGGESYKLGTQTSDAPEKMCANSAKGQHIHLIVDNKPYAAKYTAEFDYEIEDGEHYLLSFLSRSYHESIKTSAAHNAVKVDIKDNGITNSVDISDPMLFYSRPKGTYIGKDTEKVMLDFYLSNTEISESGNKVKAEINGEEHILTDWQPYYVEGLKMGQNSITLSLIDSDGNLVDTPLNPVTRTFELKEDPVPAN